MVEVGQQVCDDRSSDIYFSSNVAKEGGGAIGIIGGYLFFTFSEENKYPVQFENNSATAGGGIHASGTELLIAPEIATFVGNRGGGLACVHNSPQHVNISASFIGNTAGCGGAISVASAGDPPVTLHSILAVGNNKSGVCLYFRVMSFSVEL